MTRVAPSRDPLSGVSRLLVDGTNLLHAVSRGPDRQPPAAVVGRLRGAIPPEASIELVFDGPAERGLRGERIAHGVSVRYGGRFSADTILITLVEEAGAASADRILVVTDDVGLRHAVQRRGARTAGTTWLMRRLDRPRLSSPSVANRRPPAVSQSPRAEQREADADHSRWSPGRGATRKRGNARRSPKGP
jgi:YacP-like NYN domain